MQHWGSAAYLSDSLAHVLRLSMFIVPCSQPFNLQLKLLDLLLEFSTIDWYLRMACKTARCFRCSLSACAHCSRQLSQRIVACTILGLCGLPDVKS